MRFVSIVLLSSDERVDEVLRKKPDTNRLFKAIPVSQYRLSPPRLEPLPFLESESCRQRYDVQTFEFSSHNNARRTKQSSRTINVRSIGSRSQQKVCLTLFYRYETVSINVEETSRVDCILCLIIYQRSRNQII